MIDSMMQTYTIYTDDYMIQSRTIFGIFIGFQVFILLVMRGRMIAKMKREVFENRGILNLIPGHVFDQNKAEVEALIKKLKD
jgi:hypothetical protein